MREITAPDLLSHVVVKVLRCERANPSAAHHGAATTNQAAAVTHVTLSDGSGSDDLLGMVGASTRGGERRRPSPIPGSIASVLLRSMEDGSHVLLTHALSRTSAGGVVGGGGAPSSHDRGSLILVPTAETTASVLAPDCTLADGLATAVMVMGQDAGLALLERLPDVEGLVVVQTTGGRLEDHATSGFRSERR